MGAVNRSETIMRNSSPLKESQWKDLETCANAVHDKISEMKVVLASVIASTEDADVHNALFAQMNALGDASAKILPAYFYHPQSEWLGGSGDDAKFEMREGHIMGMRRFTVQA